MWNNKEGECRSAGESQVLGVDRVRLSASPATKIVPESLIVLLKTTELGPSFELDRKKRGCTSFLFVSLHVLSSFERGFTSLSSKVQL